MNRRKLYITGDSIYHQYLLGTYEKDSRNFIPRYLSYTTTGTLNAYDIAKKISVDDSCLPAPPFHGKNTSLRIHLVDLAVDARKDLISTLLTTDTQAAFDSFYTLAYLPEEKSDLVSVLFTDLNMGSVNRFNSAYDTFIKEPDRAFDFTLVQSQLKTFNPMWMLPSKLKIWYVEGHAYEVEWAKQFDYVIWKSSPGSIHIIPVEGRFTNQNWFTKEATRSFLIPAKELVDTNGAEDILASAIAVYLNKYLTTDVSLALDTIEHAVEFATDIYTSAVYRDHNIRPTSTLIEWEERCTLQTKTKLSPS